MWISCSLGGFISGSFARLGEINKWVSCSSLGNLLVCLSWRCCGLLIVAGIVWFMGVVLELEREMDEMELEITKWSVERGRTPSIKYKQFFSSCGLGYS